jgi:hypothetical protein
MIDQDTEQASDDICAACEGLITVLQIKCGGAIVRDININCEPYNSDGDRIDITVNLKAITFSYSA